MGGALDDAASQTTGLLKTVLVYVEIGWVARSQSIERRPMSTHETRPSGGTVGYPPQPSYEGRYEPGAQTSQDRYAHAMAAVNRHVKTPETKEFFKTSEFMVWLLTVAGVLIAGMVIGDNGGADDNLKASTVWTLVAILSFGYMLSRGISKAGTRRGHGDAPMDRD
jgi:hypothetical protein